MSYAQPTGNPTTVYSASGMSCGHCEAAVGKALSDLDGVTGVRVDVAAGRVTVTSEGEPDDALVREAVDEAGYELVGRVAPTEQQTAETL